MSPGYSTPTKQTSPGCTHEKSSSKRLAQKADRVRRMFGEGSREYEHFIMSLSKEGLLRQHGIRNYHDPEGRVIKRSIGHKRFQDSPAKKTLEKA